MADPHGEIMDRAARLFAEKGYDAASIADLAAALGLSKPAIYNYYPSKQALFDAIMAGAAGYVLKQVRGAELIDGIRRVAAGQSLLDPALTTKVLERLRHAPAEDERFAGLSDQERKILDLLAEGMTNRQIAAELFLAEKTVKNYVSNMLTKMGMQGRTEAAVYAARLAERRALRGE